MGIPVLTNLLVQAREVIPRSAPESWLRLEVRDFARW